MAKKNKKPHGKTYSTLRGKSLSSNNIINEVGWNGVIRRDFEKTLDKIDYTIEHEGATINILDEIVMLDVWFTLCGDHARCRHMDNVNIGIQIDTSSKEFNAITYKLKPKDLCLAIERTPIITYMDMYYLDEAWMVCYEELYKRRVPYKRSILNVIAVAAVIMKNGRTMLAGEFIQENVSKLARVILEWAVQKKLFTPTEQGSIIRMISKIPVYSNDEIWIDWVRYKKCELTAEQFYYLHHKFVVNCSLAEWHSETHECCEETLERLEKLELPFLSPLWDVMANNRELTKLFERAEFLRDYLGKQYIKLQSEYDSLEKKVGVYFNENSEYKSTNHKLRQELQEIQQLYKSTQSKLDELLKAECNNCTSMRDRLVAATDTIDEFNHKERGYRREIDRLGLLIEKAAEDLSEMTQKYELTKTTIERDDIIQISNDVIRQVLGDKKIAVLAESFLLPKFSAILPNIRGYTPEELKATKMLSEAFDLIITMTGFTNHAASNKSKREAAIRGIPEVRYGGRDVRTCLTLACNVICKK